MTALLPSESTNPPPPLPLSTAPTLFTTLTIFLLLLTIHTTTILHSLHSRRNKFLFVQSQSDNSNPYPRFELSDNPSPVEMSAERPAVELEGSPKTDMLTKFPTPGDLESGRGFGGGGGESSFFFRARNLVRNVFSGPRQVVERGAAPEPGVNGQEQRTMNDDDADWANVDSVVEVDDGVEVDEAQQTMRGDGANWSHGDERVDVDDNDVSPVSPSPVDDVPASPRVHLPVVSPISLPSAADQDATSRPWPPAPSAVDEATPFPSAPETHPAEPTEPVQATKPRSASAPETHSPDPTPLPTPTRKSFSDSWSRHSSCSKIPITMEFNTPQWNVSATQIESPPVSPRTTMPPAPQWDVSSMSATLFSSSPPVCLPGMGAWTEGEGEPVSPLTTTTPGSGRRASVFTVSSISDEEEEDEGDDEEDEGDDEDDEGEGGQDDDEDEDDDEEGGEDEEQDEKENGGGGARAPMVGWTDEQLTEAWGDRE